MSIEANRRFMHCPSFREGMAQSDQQKEVPAPNFHNERKGEAIILPAYDGALPVADYAQLLDVRRSLRSYDADRPMTQKELSFMLWSGQGIQFTRAHSSLRPVPSGGARHPFETYIWAQNVENLPSALYHYTPQENIGEKCCTISKVGELTNDLAAALAGQKWTANAPVVLFYTCVPYRAEWRYANMAHRVVLIDLGHLGQNIMLSAAALGMGSCCMAAYDQALCDAALGVDGINEYTVYAVAVGWGQ